MAYRIQSVERCFGLLETIASLGGAARLPTLQQATGLPMPTIFRFLSVLCALGYVHRVDNGGYLLGHKLFQLCDPAAQHQLIRRIARPILMRLAHRYDVTVNLAYRDAIQVVTYDRVVTELSIRLPLEMYARLDAHSTALGKAMMAFIQPRLVANLYAGYTLRAHTSKTITSTAMLQRRLTDIKATRIALDDEETFSGIRCLATPLLDRTGRVLSAISACASAARLEGGTQAAVGTALKAAAEDIVNALCPAPGTLDDGEFLENAD